MNIVRIFFTKTGEAAYISHLDLQRVMARGLRISGMPVWYSQGFNPHIYMSFSLPLPLGQQSLCESVDCKTEETPESCAAFAQTLDAALPRGIAVRRVAAPVHGAEAIAAAEYAFAYPAGVDVAALAEWYNAQAEAPVVRKTKRSEMTVNLKEILPKIELPARQDDAAEKTAENTLKITLPAGGEKHLNPALLDGFLQPRAGTAADITRLAIYTADGAAFL